MFYFNPYDSLYNPIWIVKLLSEMLMAVFKAELFYIYFSYVSYEPCLCHK